MAATIGKDIPIK